MSRAILGFMPAYIGDQRIPEKPPKYTVDACPVCNGRGAVKRTILKGEKACASCDGRGATWFWWIGNHRRMGPVATREMRLMLDQEFPGAR